MVKTIFLSVLEISLAVSLIIILLVLLSPLLNKRYAAKCKYWVWIVLALRLLIPFGKTTSEPSVVIDIPKQITMPLMSRGTVESVFTSGEQVKMSNLPEEDEIEFPTGKQTMWMFFGITLLDFIAGAWLIGCLAMLSVHRFSYIRFKRQVAQTGISVEDNSIVCLLQQLTEELQIRRKIDIIRYSQAASPMIIGFIRPVLIMPDEAYSREELYFILKHELLHLKRHDIYFKLFLLVVNALHWFNPIVWLMRKEATVDMELSCDESVVRGMNLEARKAYTKTLLSALNRQCARRIVLSTQFYGGKQVMKKRFQNILIGTRKKNGFSIVVCAAVLTLAVGSLLGCSIKEMPLGVNGNSVGIVHTDVGALRVREEPDRDATVIGLLPNGAEVTILGEENEFYRINLLEEEDTVEGYVRKEYIAVEYSVGVSEPTFTDQDGTVYIVAFLKDMTENSITVDVIEYVTSDNAEKVNELGLTERDMPDGYYLYNPEQETFVWELNEQTVYSFIDWNGDFTGFDDPREYTTTDAEEFHRYIETYDNAAPGMPFFFQVEDGVVTMVLEKFFA